MRLKAQAKLIAGPDGESKGAALHPSQAQGRDQQQEALLASPPLQCLKIHPPAGGSRAVFW